MGNVIAIKGARMTEFNNGKSLNLGEDCKIEINPTNDKSTKLQLFYQRNGGAFPNMRSISEGQRDTTGG